MNMKIFLSVCTVAAAGSMLLGGVDLTGYKPVDPAKNVVKNGNFEGGNAQWINSWGKVTPTMLRDFSVKHGGRASLKIGNAPKSVAVAYFSLGTVPNTKQDLLIRGWYKTQGIKRVTYMPFIGIWFLSKKWQNAGASIPSVKIAEGDTDWTRFECIVTVDQLKKAAGTTGHYYTFRINLHQQPGWVWLDDLEIIPLEKK